MRKISFALLLIALLVALTSVTQTVAADSPTGYLRFAGGSVVRLARTEQRELVVNFGPRHGNLEDVSVFCNVQSSLPMGVITMSDQGGRRGPFTIVGGFYGQSLIYGAYRYPSTVNLYRGQRYQISFFVRLNDPLPADYRGVVGSIECKLIANNNFNAPVAVDTVLIRARR